MKKLVVITQVLILSLGISFAFGQKDIEKIKALIDSIPKINIDQPGEVIEPGTSAGFEGTADNRKEILLEKRKLTKTLKDFIAFNPHNDALFPGSLIQGKSLSEGSLSAIKVYRNPLIINVSGLISSDPTASFHCNVEHPNLANVSESIKKILNQNLNKDQPAVIAYNQTTISSVEEGFLKLGASYKWVTGNVTTSFQLSSNSYKTALMVRFIQSYYTVNCVNPKNPVDFISNKTRFEDFKHYASQGNPPVFISSVTYGRELWMLIESNYNDRDIKLALDAAANPAIIEMSADSKKVLKESNIQVLALGGSGTSATEIITGDIGKLKEYLRAGANYSSSSPGVPISYTARYLIDNQEAIISSTIDYTYKKSKPAPPPLTKIIVTWNTTGDDKENDTEAVIDVYDKQENHIGHLACCNVGMIEDYWGAGKSVTKELEILSKDLTYNDFTRGRLEAKGLPHSNKWINKDSWDYKLKLEFLFSDDTRIFKEGISENNDCSISW